MKKTKKERRRRGRSYDRAERLTMERAEQSAEMGGVGVRACGVKSREMRWVSLRERIDNILGTFS